MFVLHFALCAGITIYTSHVLACYVPIGGERVGLGDFMDEKFFYGFRQFADILVESEWFNIFDMQTYDF